MKTGWNTTEGSQSQYRTQNKCWLWMNKCQVAVKLILTRQRGLLGVCYFYVSFLLLSLFIRAHGQTGIIGGEWKITTATQNSVSWKLEGFVANQELFQERFQTKSPQDIHVCWVLFQKNLKMIFSDNISTHHYQRQVIWKPITAKPLPYCCIFSRDLICAFIAIAKKKKKKIHEIQDPQKKVVAATNDANFHTLLWTCNIPTKRILDSWVGNMSLSNCQFVIHNRETLNREKTVIVNTDPYSITLCFVASNQVNLF